ncbi:MAG: hypothetical protein O7C75_15470 [Verrucomicrobia bacterium]|nr:hypothetical protein [Verrucomicrobiota bacterium]
MFLNNGISLIQKFPLLVLLFAIVLPGCTIVRNEYELPSAQTGNVVEGKTHYSKVLDIFGPPLKLSALDNGMVFLYERASTEENQFGVSISIQNLSIFKFVLGRGKADQEVALFNFDSEGILRSTSIDSWSSSLGSSASLQFILALLPVTDAGGIGDSPPALNWGAGLLQPDVAIALNQSNSLDTGLSGVERQGTPRNAGQRALEFHQ